MLYPGVNTDMARIPSRLFAGFSTVETERTGEWRYYDIDLVRRDLLNHFHTRIGERVMRPDFGCRIWDYLMEPLTDGMVQMIADEARRIVQADTRCDIADVFVSSLDNGVRVEIMLNYVPFGVLETFAVDFERREDARQDVDLDGFA